MITLVPFLLDSVLFGQEHSDQVKVADLRKRSTKVGIKNFQCIIKQKTLSSNKTVIACSL